MVALDIVKSGCGMAEQTPNKMILRSTGGIIYCCLSQSYNARIIGRLMSPTLAIQGL